MLLIIDTDLPYHQSPSQDDKESLKTDSEDMSVVGSQTQSRDLQRKAYYVQEQES
jgi:hypothetical protein